jgi:hypothetical protein
MPQNGWKRAMSCSAEALAVSREQSVLAVEIRSAGDLARLMSERGQRDQEPDVLCRCMTALLRDLIPRTLGPRANSSRSWPTAGSEVAAKRVRGSGQPGIVDI